MSTELRFARLCVMCRPVASAAPEGLDHVLSSHRPHPQALSSVQGTVFQG